MVQPLIAVIGTTEWLVIAFVVVLLFGARKLPELARSMGSSVNEFKKGMSEGVKPEDEKPRSDARPTSTVNGSTKDH
jgi:sec-independent protein translocase protein TatA